MKVDDPITAFRNGVLCPGRVRAFDNENVWISWITPAGVGADIVRVSTEGIDWMAGHGPEVESALDAACRLLDDAPTLPFNFPVGIVSR